MHKSKQSIGKYAYNCRMDKCAVSQKACEQYKYLGSISQSHLAKSSEFTSKHLKCSHLDVCMKNTGCFGLVFKAEHQLIELKSECPCTAAHSYSCTSKYCTYDKKTCDKFKKTVSQNKSNLSKIVNC